MLPHCIREKQGAGLIFRGGLGDRDRKSQVLASGVGELWAKGSGEAILETRPETRVGGIDVEDKGTLSLLVNGEPEVGEVQKQGQRALPCQALIVATQRHA